MVCRLRGIQGQQVGPGRTERRIATGQCRKKLFILRNDSRRPDQPGPSSGISVMTGSVRAGKRPAHCVKNRVK
jgi:hypothetical protein